MLFSALSCLFIFLCTFKKQYILKILGWFLTPLLLLSLLLIIFLGFFNIEEAQSIDDSKMHIFMHGLKEGYHTMDLLAAFFFSSTILHLLKMQKEQRKVAFAQPVKRVLLADFYLQQFTLALVILPLFYGTDLAYQSKDELLAAITLKVAGSSAGLIVCITIALACLTTAIALITAFTDFFHKEVLDDDT